MKYICKYGFYHHKQVRHPNHVPSNNGWIYTAFAKVYGLPIKDLSDVYKGCLEYKEFPFYIKRTPEAMMPDVDPISRDEIIGMVSLGYMKTLTLHIYNWKMYDQTALPTVSLIRQLKALWEIRKKHRTYVWKFKVYDAYPLAFALAPHDRYYIKKFCNEKTTIFETVMFYLYLISTLVQRDNSDLNILWLQLNDLKMYDLLKYIDIKKVNREVYPEDHPFNNGEK